jgi:hypothetical protein
VFILIYQVSSQGCPDLQLDAFLQRLAASTELFKHNKVATIKPLRFHPALYRPPTLGDVTNMFIVIDSCKYA